MSSIHASHKPSGLEETRDSGLMDSVLDSDSKDLDLDSDSDGVDSTPALVDSDSVLSAV